MSVAAFTAHADDSFEFKEKPLLFLLIFIFLFFAGPGKYSVGDLLKKQLLIPRGDFSILDQKKPAFGLYSA